MFSNYVKSSRTSDVSTHLKKFLKIFPGLSLLPPGVVGVVGAVVEKFDVEFTVGDTSDELDMLLDYILSIISFTVINETVLNTEK